ncbi:MAG: hypothetical protein ACKVIN_16615, partial [Longimicrobiales bacterium]
NLEDENFTVVLDAQPETDVTFTLTNPDPGEIEVEFSTLTFTSANWDTPQNVKVIGQPDLTSDGDTVTTITISVDGSSPAPFAALADKTVEATNTDVD